MSEAQRPAPFHAMTELDVEQLEAGANVCIPNINFAERRKRLRMGGLAFGAALVILLALAATGVSRWWRLPLFFVFVGAASGYFQWRDRTCVGLASVSSRKLGDKVEKIEDAGELAQVRRQARRVQTKALLAAVPLTVLALLVPSLR